MGAVVEQMQQTYDLQVSGYYSQLQLVKEFLLHERELSLETDMNKSFFEAWEKESESTLIRYFIQTTLKRIISSISNSLVIFFLLFTVCSISTFTVQPLYNLPVLTAAVLLTLLRSMHLIMLYL